MIVRSTIFLEYRPAESQIIYKNEFPPKNYSRKACTLREFRYFHLSANIERENFFLVSDTDKFMKLFYAEISALSA